MIFKVIITVLPMFASSVYASSGLACDHDSKNFRCVKYIRNYDADTITVNIPNVHPLLGEEISVRVLGIDTPELRTNNRCEKEAGIRARDLVSKLLKDGKRIDLENVSRDKYFRIDADVIVDGQNLRNALLGSDMAIQYNGGTKREYNWCKRTEIGH